jgi:hypothetical protein
VKNQFQSLPFKFNLQRYKAEAKVVAIQKKAVKAMRPFVVGLCTLESS